MEDFLFSLLPEEFKAELKEHLEHIRTMPSRTNSAFLLFSAGLILAQSQRYLGMDIHTAGDLPRVVSAFLSIEPSPPTVDKLAALINRLLEGFAKWRVRLVDDAGMEVWEVIGS